jgi:guanylate kinase
MQEEVEEEVERRCVERGKREKEELKKRMEVREKEMQMQANERLQI